MGPVDWLAVIVAAGVATVVLRLFAGRSDLKAAVFTLALTLVSAAMLGHNYARIGAERLAERPWLYPMQAGGLAIAFVIPALWIAQSRSAVPARENGRDSLTFLIAYLVMGAVFWLRG